MINDKGTKVHSLLQIQPVYSAREAWSELAESEGLGYEVLELSMPPALNESGLFKSILEWCKESGRVRSLHGCFIDINPASGDAALRKFSRDRYMESMKTAKDLGAENVVFHSSCFPFLRGPYMEGWSAMCADFYEELAEESGLNIFIENSFDIDPGPMKNLMSIIRDKRIGVCMDIGHANYSGTDVAAWFEELGDHIGYLHLSDNMGKYDDHLPLGKGTVDWSFVNHLFKRLNRKVPMTLEVGNINNVKTSIDFLKENRYFGLYEGAG